MTEPDRSPPADPVPAVGPPAADAASAPVSGADLDRRRFFRAFATEMVHTAATVVGAATAIQRSSAEAANAILNPAGVSTDTARPPTAALAADLELMRSAGQLNVPPPAAEPPRATYRSAFLVEEDRLVVINQRRLPEISTEDCRTAIDVANAITERTIVGGGAIAGAAAQGLALSAQRVRSSRPYARRAILRAAATSLTGAAPASRRLRAAVDRVMARYLAIGELDENGDRIAEAMAAEADAIVFESTDDHGRLVDAAVARLPGTGLQVVRILTVGSTGTLAGGTFGTALAVAQSAHHTGRGVHVTVLEGRPNLDGARIAAWELREAGVPHEVVPDAAAAAVVQSGRMHVVLLGAMAIAANGDLINDNGTFAIASAAAGVRVPVFVCAPLAAVDTSAETGSALPTDDRAANGVPVVDRTPAELITRIATEEGVLGPPYGESIAAALEARARRLPASLAGAAVIPTGSVD